MATMKLMVQKTRLEKGPTDFSSHTGNVGFLGYESQDRTIDWSILIAEDAVNTAHFLAHDDGTNVMGGSLLVDKSTPMIYMMTVTGTTWAEIGDIT